MPPAHCGVAYLAYRTLLTNGAIYSQAGHFLCAFPILHYFMRGFQECKQTVLQSARGPVTRSGKAMFGALLGGTNPSPHKRRLN